jgi:hypothetical protein
MGAPRNEVKIGHLGDGGNFISGDGSGDGTTPRTCTDFCLHQILLYRCEVNRPEHLCLVSMEPAAAERERRRVLRLLDAEEGLGGLEGLDAEEGLEGLEAEEGLDGFEVEEGLEGPEGLDAEEGLEGLEAEEGLEGLEAEEGLEGLEVLEAEGSGAFHAPPQPAPPRRRQR